MGEFSIWHAAIVLVILLIFFGPSRIAPLGNSLGKAIRGFKDGLKGVSDELKDEKPAQSAREPLPGGDQAAENDKNKTKNSSS